MEPLARADAVTWFNLSFLLTFISITKKWLDGDVASAMVVLSVISTNVGQFDQRPESMRAYLPAGSIPDELRRPATASSVALSLGIPRETARGKLEYLTQTGTLRYAKTGYILGIDNLKTPLVAQSLPAYFSALSDFIDELRRIGGYRVETFHTLQNPMWLVGGALLRLSSVHVLREVAHASSLSPGLRLAGLEVLLAAAYQGGATVARDCKAPNAGGSLTGLKQGLNVVTATSVARYIDRPHETVRRHLKSLVGRDDLARTSRGFEINIPNPIIAQRWLDFQIQSEASTRLLIWKMLRAHVLVRQK